MTHKYIYIYNYDRTNVYEGKFFKYEISQTLDPADCKQLVLELKLVIINSDNSDNISKNIFCLVIIDYSTYT